MGHQPARIASCGRYESLIIALVLMPVLMIVSIFIQRAVTDRPEDRRIVVVDGTQMLFEGLSVAVAKRNDTEIFDECTGEQIADRYLLEHGGSTLDDSGRLALSERVRSGELFAFVEIPANVLESPTERDSPRVLVFGKDLTVMQARRWFQQTLSLLAYAIRLRQAGVDAALAMSLARPLEFQDEGLYERLPTGEIRQSDASSRRLAFFVPFAVMMLMFMSIMMVAQPLLQSVIEEKQQRIAEVLLGSASPFEIMAGKLVANVAASLTVVAVYIAGGFATVWHMGVARSLPTDLVIWFFVYQVLAVLLFGSVFIAIGAACSELKEAQSLMTPVMVALVLLMMVWVRLLRDPLSSFSLWVSLIPPATPMLMTLRMAANNSVPIWQPVIGIVLVLLTTLFCVFAAARVFRIGILAQGKAPKMSELIRWAITG